MYSHCAVVYSRIAQVATTVYTDCSQNLVSVSGLSQCSKTEEPAGSWMAWH